jgi:hypothetical protein
MREDKSARFGKTELLVMSNGPGTSTKCVYRMIWGYDAMRSARESKLSIPLSDEEKGGVGCQVPWYL